MRTDRAPAAAWWAAGLVAGVAGLATSYFAAMALTLRDSPVVAVAEMVIRLTPGAVVEKAISVLGHHDKTVLVAVVLALTALLLAWTGALARRAWWAPLPVLAALTAVGAIGVAGQRGQTAVDQVPVLVGLATWVVCLALLTAPLRRTTSSAAPAPSAPVPAPAPDRLEDRTGRRPVPPGRADRRAFLVRGVLLAAGAAVLAAAGRAVGSGRRHVEETRRLLRLSGVSAPRVPRGARIGLDGVGPWLTPASDFYRVHTAIVVPAIEPADWRLRIHGMVDREVEVSYQQLVGRGMAEGWITLNCVSNPVGGPLIGNAWWSGVRVRDLLEEAGVRPGADAVLQTSHDGWTCGTPLAALTDDRDALLAVAMNGEPLPIDHGFPVRTIVPGLYGYVSACKWVVDLEVTRFADVEAYWTQRGWGERGPVKMSSRIEVPGSGETVTAGDVRVGGSAWHQHVGIAAVEVALDGTDWQRAAVSRPGTPDTWVQWAATLHVDPGDHVLRVRAIDRDGEVQTGVERGVLPDGATGWHTVGFSAE